MTADFHDPYVQILADDVRSIWDTLTTIHERLPTDVTPDRREIAVCLVEMAKIRRKVDHVAEALQVADKPAGRFG